VNDSEKDSTITNEVATFAAGLRAMAAWYEDHPQAPVPASPAIRVTNMEETKEAAAGLARMLGTCDKMYSDAFFRLTRDFGGVSLEFVFYRSSVCTRRVIGTKLIPAQPATPEREVELVEWDCPDTLLGGGAS
jgi:hypothetical protein